MAELDRVRERIAYLKLWQGIMVVTNISLIGWLITAAAEAPPRTFALAFSGAIANGFDMQTLAAILMFVVILVFVGIGLHAGRDKDSQRGK
jgi:uncharacterized membrane protein YdjX (TVP38/TMEM64 family)